MEEKTTPVNIARKYNITREPDEQLPPEIEKLIAQAYREIDKKSPDVNKLESWAAKYPLVPQFKNYLTVIYHNFGNHTKADQLNDELLASFPDYIFAKLKKASEYLEKEEFEKVPEILGKELDISALYPTRNTFHITEVTSFLHIVFRYYLLTDNLGAAELKLEELIDVDPDDPMIESFTMQLTVKEMENNMSYIASEETNTRRVKYIAPAIKKTTEKPSFNHPEIEYLYEQGMRIDQNLIRQILELPRETLIADLESVISDGISRYDTYFELGYEEPLCCFVPHAVFLLSELKATESLSVILELLRQGEDFFDFWFSDSSNEYLWECIYHLANNKLDILSDFLKEPNRYTYARTVVSMAVLQMALYQPNRRDEIIAWYRQLFIYFLDQKDNEDIIDSDLLGAMIGDTIDFRGKELLGEIEALYNTGYVQYFINGSFDDVKIEMDEAPYDYASLDLYNIYERYDYILNNWDYYQNEKDLYPDQEDMDDDNFSKDYEYTTPETYKREEPKIGRNDPCPCGSGKKYKKCCLKE